jgi:hypothetical protein
MTVLAALAALGLCDGALSGFRSGTGRTGLIRHRAWDRRALRRGLVVSVVLLAPAVVLALLNIGLTGQPAAARWSVWREAGVGMLLVYLPYGVLCLLALAGYATLPWRYRFRAIAVILGPFTLVRPGVAVAGGVLAVARTGDLVVGLGVLLAVAGVLMVGPVCDRLWYGVRARRVEGAAGVVGRRR